MLEFITRSAVPVEVVRLWPNLIFRSSLFRPFLFKSNLIPEFLEILIGRYPNQTYQGLLLTKIKSLK